ncbi:hypothetical protein F3Y22_tig00013040pilonHSYRG00130 [Hibiscus syriacus]|uniref:Uncharacterized protein n=1 Tax=Hibiscus syriacus TaxID=106335 RepID=A0A6A3C2Q6_HIBSY|nr:hypothetical protein F3Y22_tig00013040pilonHSYRG00130 [Hibiscus syriacus]
MFFPISSSPVAAEAPYDPFTANTFVPNNRQAFNNGKFVGSESDDQLKSSAGVDKKKVRKPRFAFRTRSPVIYLTMDIVGGNMAQKLLRTTNSQEAIIDAQIKDAM